MGYFIPRPPQSADEDIMQHISPQIANVRVIVNGRPASVKAHLARSRLEDLL
jgi:hypothetical protein